MGAPYRFRDPAQTALLVSVLAPETTVVQDDVSVYDIVTKAPPPESDAVLTLTHSYAHQFSDGMDTTTIERVFLEDFESVSVSIGEILVVPMQTPHEVFKVRGGANSEAWRHPARRRAALTLRPFPL